jgi:chemotaxis protein CheX
MEESILKIFATSIIRYFEATTGQPALLGTPYLGVSEEPLALDFSAIIGISGTYRGNIYYTAPRAKLDEILTILGETEGLDDSLRGELVGEITNTISGNAREELGGGFMISTPFLLHGRNDAVKPAQGAPCFVLPIEWNNHSSRVLISLLKVEDSTNS